MNNVVFAKPELFYLLLGLIPMILWYIFRQKKSKASIQISTLESLKKAPLTWKHFVRHLVFVLQLAGFNPFDCLSGPTAVVRQLAKPNC